MPRELLPPADDTASRAVVDVQTATTRVKALVTTCVSMGLSEKETTEKLNEMIAQECKRFSNDAFRRQFGQSLVTAARRWHYELSESLRVANANLEAAAMRQPLTISLGALMRMTPFEKETEFRKVLDSGESVGIPIIRDYQKTVRLALRAVSAEAPKMVQTRGGRMYIMPARLRAELAVRYAAAVENLQDLISAGVPFAWISSHASCSPRCAPFQGRLYSLFDGEAEIDGVKYGTSGKIDGIPYRPINIALAGVNEDGNGCISGYGCRHRAVEYKRGSRPPEHYTAAEMKKEYAVDEKQRAYENRIRQLKTEEKTYRAAGMIDEAKSLRKKWRAMTADYQMYSLDNGRAFYPYRCVVDETELPNNGQP